MKKKTLVQKIWIVIVALVAISMVVLTVAPYLQQQPVY